MLPNNAKLNSEVSNLNVTRDVLSSGLEHMKDGPNTGLLNSSPSGLR